MSRNQRIGALTLAAVVLVAAFLVARPKDEDATPTTPTAPPGATTRNDATQPAKTTATRPPPAPKRDPGPLLTKGRVKEISVRRGDTVRLRARSSQPEELHVHGYDLVRELKPGQTGRLRFKADLEGIFEIEFERSKTKVASLKVEP